MYKKFSVLTASLAATALLLAVASVQAEDRSGGATATDADMPALCKAQAATLNLTGTAADDFLKTCGSQASDTTRESGPKLEGKL